MNFPLCVAWVFLLQRSIHWLCYADLLFYLWYTMGSFFSSLFYLVFCVLLLLVWVCLFLRLAMFSSTIMLKIWPMSLTWDSSPLSMPIIQKFGVCHDVLHFLCVPFLSFLFCFSLFWWIFCVTWLFGLNPLFYLRPDILSSAWFVLLVILRLF